MPSTSSATFPLNCVKEHCVAILADITFHIIVKSDIDVKHFLTSHLGGIRTSRVILSLKLSALSVMLPASRPLRFMAIGRDSNPNVILLDAVAYPLGYKMTC